MAPIYASDQPPSYTDHGVPGLVCSPAKWTSVLLFYAVNYLAHCATVKPYPAETQLETTSAILCALFLPSSGISRAMDSIVRRPRLRRGLNDLERACVADALCMVVRKGNWKPESGDTVPIHTRNLLGEQLIEPVKRPRGTAARVTSDLPQNYSVGSMGGEDQIEVLHSSSVEDGTIERVFHR